MRNFYFTFGTDPLYPYQGTYLIVKANDIHEAIKKFQSKYPNRPGSSAYNAAFSYSEETWERSCSKYYPHPPVEVIK